ncbi:hypothetical protein M9H77_09486 [Catharanthus roseus]|uniref:Uncharacterized protein n=1 Tax=Catharanthus roseus TaxID=4058 RepID=A0ACC0C154_CATRO|nr:hypothetical protein M9H77_09486 [Catharanthus roseus]
MDTETESCLICSSMRLLSDEELLPIIGQLHPSEHYYAKQQPQYITQQWSIVNRERDAHRDGKVNFKEFFHGLFDMVRNYDEEDHRSNDQSHDSEEHQLESFST